MSADEYIIKLFFDRDRRAIEEADKKYGKYLLTVASNILHNVQDGEECVNDTYLSAWNTIPPKRPASLKHYLCGITRNNAISKYRSENAQKRAGVTLCIDELNDLAAPEDDDSAEIRRVLDEFLKSCSPRDMTVFVYRYYYMYPVEKIAEHYRISQQAVYKILDKMKNKLRDRLNKEGITV